MGPEIVTVLAGGQRWSAFAHVEVEAALDHAARSLLQIAQALDRFNVGVTTDQELEPIERYQITPGETAFGAVEKLARKQGLTLAGEADGSIRITKAGAARQAGGLFEGRNIRNASADLNWAGRHSPVTVRGQQADGHGEALQVEASAEDEAIGRFRPLIIVADDAVGQDEAQKRAEYRVSREAGESLRASVRVQGFRDDAGALWTPGKLVWLE